MPGRATRRFGARLACSSLLACLLVNAPPAAHAAGGCSGGSLGLAVPGTLDLSGVALTGTDQSTAPASVGLAVSDMTGTGAGWNLTATSTTLTDTAGHTLPATATQLVSATAGSQPGTCTPAQNTVSYAAPLVLPAGAPPPPPIKVFAAAPGTGLGPGSVTFGVRLVVPASAYAGTYSSTWSLTVASGP
jgi:hypothetical protein